MLDNQNKERLLLHHNGPQSPERILVFATNNSISYLQEDTWFIDGNFDLALKFFTQCYALRV